MTVQCCTWLENVGSDSKYALGKAKRDPSTSQPDTFAGAKVKEKIGLLRSEDVTKLEKSDFFVPKLIVFSVTFGRKTKKSQPLGMTGLGFFGLLVAKIK